MRIPACRAHSLRHRQAPDHAADGNQPRWSVAVPGGGHALPLSAKTLLDGRMRFFHILLSASVASVVKRLDGLPGLWWTGRRDGKVESVSGIPWGRGEGWCLPCLSFAPLRLCVKTSLTPRRKAAKTREEGAASGAPTAPRSGRLRKPRLFPCRGAACCALSAHEGPRLSGGPSQTRST